MTEQDIYRIAKAWIEKDHENSAVDWVKLMAADLNRRFEYQKTLVKESDSLPCVSICGDCEGKGYIYWQNGAAWMKSECSTCKS